MKKILIPILILVLVLSFAGCGTTAPTETSGMVVETSSAEPTTTEEATTETSVEPSEEMPAANGAADAAIAYFHNMPEHSYKIPQKDFIDKVAAGEAMFILDIRSAADYEKGHVKGAVNAPWGPAIAENLNKIPQTGEVFIYCYTGQTAGQAVMTLNAAGIPARSVNLGWNLGISKVEGLDAVTETTANAFGSETFTVDETIQAAITEYYAGLAAVKETPFANYKISEDDLLAKMEAKEDLYILSVRSAKDYAISHIDGAANVPFGKELVDNLGNVPKDKKVVVYCYTGQTAGQTVAAMRLMGFDAVSLNGGMGMAANLPNGWMNKGYPVVSDNAAINAAYKYFANMPEHSYKIAQQEFVDKVAAGDAMFIVDIRSAEDYGKGHVKGAFNAPWGPAIAENLNKIPQDKEVFIYCYTGQTAGQAVVTLNMAGINARSVNLGWNMGISKAEGVAAVTETTANAFGTETFTVDAEIQDAANAYYAGLAEVKETKFANYKVSEDDLKAMIDTKEDFYLLSVRKAEDFVKGHIQGAANVPFGKATLTGLMNVPKTKKVVVYCYTGQTAGQVVAAMRYLGYDAVSLNGGAGMEANAPMGWTNKGYELVTD